MNKVAILLCGALSLLFWSQPAGAQEYSVTRLDPPSTNFYNFSSAVGINNNGVVIGSGSGQYTTDLLCVWLPGQTIGTPHYFWGYNRTSPEGINDNGDVVGYGPDDDGKPHGFVNSTDLGLGNTNDINNKGQVVGWTFDSLYLYKDGVFDFLPTSYWGSEALSINDSGVAVGYWYTDCASDCYEEVCIFRGDTITLLGTLGGIYAEGTDINNRGQIAGWSCLDFDCTAYRGFVWDNGNWTTIPTLGGAGSNAEAINDHGVVVGQAYTSGNVQTAIIFDTINGLRDLNTLIPPGSGWQLLTATGINNRGQIVGVGKHGGLTRAFLLTPPLTLLLKDINGDVIPNATVTVSRLRNDPPDFSAYWSEEATSDESGEVEIGSNALVPGDTFVVSMIVHSEPAVKHPGLLGTMYTVYLDNMVIGSDSKPTFPIVGEGIQEVIMQHTTVAWNMVISIEWDARTDYWTTLQSGIRGMANYLYDVSDGQMRFDTVKIYGNSVNWSVADVKIHASNIQHPKTYSDSIRGLNGPVLMPRKWFGNNNACRNGSYAENPLSLTDSVNYTTLCHEWGHYAFGFGDEYNFLGGVRCGSVANYGFMDGQYPYPRYGPYRSEMSSANRYAQAACQNNRHWAMRAMSCWDWFHQGFEKWYTYSLDSVFVPIKRPQDRNIPAGQDYLTGPNDVLTVPDYDVGALVVFPDAPSFATTSTYPVTLTNAATGSRLGDVNVQMKIANTGRTLNQGNTSDSGSIWLLGSTLADTVVAAGRITVGAPTLRSVTQVSQEEWYSFTSMLFDILSAGGIAELRPASGDYHLLFRPEWSGDSATLRILSRDTLASLPELGLEAEGVDTLYSLAWEGGAYVGSLGSIAPSEGIMALNAVDDSGYAFFVPNPFGRYLADSTSGSKFFHGPGGTSDLLLDAGNASVQSVLIVESQFPVIRDGLPTEAIQAGPAVGMAFEGTNDLVGDNILTIQYDDAALNALDSALENSLRIWAWDEALEQWTLAGGTVDTALDEVSGPVARSGIYAAFTTAVSVGIFDEPDGALPTTFELKQNYPNPFNPVTTIEYSLTGRMNVTIEVFNVLGQKVRTLVSETKPAGSYRIDWNSVDDLGKPVASGVYLYRFQAGETTQTKKMVLLR